MIWNLANLSGRRQDQSQGDLAERKTARRQRWRMNSPATSSQTPGSLHDAEAVQAAFALGITAGDIKFSALFILGVVAVRRGDATNELSVDVTDGGHMLAERAWGGIGAASEQEGEQQNKTIRVTVAIEQSSYRGFLSESRSAAAR